MKRTYLIIMLIIGFNLFSLDHGLISGFEAGYNLQEAIIFNNELIDNRDSLYLQLKIGYRIDNFRIVGTYTNTLFKVDFDRYIPIQDDYRIDINYTFGDIKIGFFHFCNHPVVSQNDERENFVNRGQRAFYVSYYKEF